MAALPLCDMGCHAPLSWLVGTPDFPNLGLGRTHNALIQIGQQVAVKASGFAARILVQQPHKCLDFRASLGSRDASHRTDVRPR